MAFPANSVTRSDMMTRIRNRTEKHSKLLLPNQPIIALTLSEAKVNIMGKSLLLAGMLTVFCADLFGQSINSVTVSPQVPTSTDDVTLVINGDKWSSDIVITAISIVQNFSTWTVDIEFMPGGIGLPVIVPFDTIVSLGTMPIGYYDCQVNGLLNSTVQDFDGATWAVLDPVGISSHHSEELKFMCTPNPFSSEAMLNISIPKAGKVNLKLYDILGQEVASVIDKYYEQGVHKLKFLTPHLPSGRYYFHLSSEGKVLIKQVVKKD
ncbi:MAG: hypothetical protein ACI9EQ_000730 [Bacteroidia bacterium]|jgi:hypothetical protein